MFFCIFQVRTLGDEQYGVVRTQPLLGRSGNRFECFRTARKPKSPQIDHFLNRNVQEFCAFPNQRICLPDACLCCRYHPCDRFTKRRAIQRCEDVTGCKLLVGFAAGILIIFESLHFKVSKTTQVFDSIHVKEQNVQIQQDFHYFRKSAFQTYQTNNGFCMLFEKLHSIFCICLTKYHYF